MIEELTLRVLDAKHKYDDADRDRAAAMLEGGQVLLDAKASLAHGEFGPFLERVGVTPRTAQRWMLLVKAGLKSDTVTLLGGLARSVRIVKDVVKVYPDFGDWPSDIQVVVLKIYSKMKAKVDCLPEIQEALSGIDELPPEERIPALLKIHQSADTVLKMAGLTMPRNSDPGRNQLTTRRWRLKR